VFHFSSPPLFFYFSFSMSNLGDAPHEVLSLVLNNVDRRGDLYQCALVNKNFNATTNPLLWREPRLMTLGTLRKDTICFRLKQSLLQTDKHCLHSSPLGHYVRKLNASHDNCLQDFHSVINHVPLVKELVIGIKKLKDKDIERIALNCPQLKCLFCFCYTDSNCFFDPLRLCANLREFSIVGIFNLKRLLASLQHCQLEKLKLCALHMDVDFTKNTLFGAIPSLTHLELYCPAKDFIQYCQTLPSRTPFPVLTDLRIAIGEKYGILTTSMWCSFWKHTLLSAPSP
jgi:hypothetical protein